MFNISAKEEFDDSAIVDLEEDNNKSDEEEVAEETPKKKGRPGRKKGKYFFKINVLTFYSYIWLFLFLFKTMIVIFYIRKKRKG